ncbi:MAG: hypothetical protein ACXWCE_20915 [Caldimonas sp.]
MQTNASIVRSLAVAAALVAVACAGPSSGPSKPSGGGGTTGSGGGGTTGTGGGDNTGGNGGSTGTGGAGGGGGGTTTPPPDGGTTMAGIGCNSYVACLTAAMSAADAMACDAKASTNATNILDAVDTCVGNVCLGMAGGGAARCKAATDGSLTNLDGTPAFDATTGAPSGDCGTCLVNGEAALWGDTCMPATDPACNTSACATQVAACHADG